jgi:CRP/FNR family transcriptional regulator, cyclic AMP receptor protein
MHHKPRSPHLYTAISKGRLLRLSKRSVFYSSDKGSDIMFVVKGYVKRYGIRSDGCMGMQIIYGSQDIFSLTKTFRTLLDFDIYDGPETFYYETMSDAEIYSLPLSAIAEIADTDPVIYKELLTEAAHHLKACVNSIENVSLKSTYARVAHIIVFLMNTFGKDTSEGVQLEAPVKHQDIADMLGLARATVTLAIVKLRENGLILSGTPLTVPDMERLVKEAYI